MWRVWSANTHYIAQHFVHKQVSPWVVYIRLHGNPKMFYSEYPEAYLLELHNKLTDNKKFKEVYVFFNNTASTAGIINAQVFKALSE